MAGAGVGRYSFIVEAGFHLRLRTLRRRSQKDMTNWERITRLENDWLPKPRILQPWPGARFAVNHPR